MFDNLLFLCTVTALLVSCYWSIPATRPSARRWVLVGGSLLILFAKNPYSAVVIGTVSLLCAVWSPLLARPNGDRWLTPALASVLAPLAWWRGHGLSDLIMLGIAFTMIRAATVLADSAWRKIPISISQILCLNLFFPTVSAGPIERPGIFALSGFGASFSLPTFLDGLTRILVGVFKINYLSSLLHLFIDLHWPDAATHPPGGKEAWFCVLLRFVAIYLDFSGYTDIAIGLAALFSFKLRENFHYPFVATSLQQFWQRWHRSLADVVVNYIYFPIVRRTGRLGLAIVVAFSIIGLWHQFKFPYVLWGLGHASGLALERWVRLNVGDLVWRMPFGIDRVASCVLTILYVAVLSSVGAASDVYAVGRLLAGLTRW